MTPARILRPTILLVSARGTLHDVDQRLRRAGVRLVRVHVIEPRPIDPKEWLRTLPEKVGPDTVVATSRVAVDAGILPWKRAMGRHGRSVEFWAVGPGTAEALRRAGIRRIRRPPAVGASALVAALGRVPRRTILYFRSDRAGPGLARNLRRRGHRVLDRVVYRLGRAPTLTPREKEAVSRAALLVVTSPSGLQELQRRLGRLAFSRLAKSSRLVVLGERSRRAAVRSGFRYVSVAPSTTAQRFTHHLLQELRNAAA